jgi:hypothetical protein
LEKITILINGGSSPLNQNDMTKVTFNGELILELHSKQEWINKVPNWLPEKRKAEVRIWLDENDNCLAIGEDFMKAEEIKSYPVRVYSLQRVTEAY